MCRNQSFLQQLFWKIFVMVNRQPLTVKCADVLCNIGNNSTVSVNVCGAVMVA